MIPNGDGQAVLAVSLQLAPKNATLKSGGSALSWTIQEMNYQPHFASGIDEFRRSQVQPGRANVVENAVNVERQVA